MRIVAESTFNLKTTGLSFYDSLLDNRPLNNNPKNKYTIQEYYAFEKGICGVIKEMTCNEYLQNCAKIFGKSTESQYRSVDYKNVDDYAKSMERGSTFPICFLDYVNNTQEGRHRAIAYEKTFGKDAKFPVLIVIKPHPTDDEIKDYALRKWGEDEVIWGINYVKGCLNVNESKPINGQISFFDNPITEPISIISEPQISNNTKIYLIYTDSVINVSRMYIPDSKKIDINRSKVAWRQADAKIFNKDDAYKKAGSMTKNSKNGYIWEVEVI